MLLQVDSSWKKHMRQTQENPVAIAVTSLPGVLEMFQWANSVLDEVQKSLEQYLDTKRAALPRFYFLSNDELLQVCECCGFASNSASVSLTVSVSLTASVSCFHRLFAVLSLLMFRYSPC